jgi:hypothetical protein
MMHGPEKSDPAIVAMKPANKAEQSAAESVERRAGTKGNADQQSTYRTQSRANVSQALERIRKVASDRFAVTHPRWEPYAGTHYHIAKPRTCVVHHSKLGRATSDLGSVASHPNVRALVACPLCLH